MSFRSQPRLEEFPALGFVPCPGRQESMDSVAQTFSDTADVLAEVNAVLTGADDGEWRGETARAFRQMLREDFQPKVENAWQSFSDAYRAMSDWVLDMEDFQRRADNLEEEAATALEEVQIAQAAVDGLPAESEGSDDEDREETEGGESPEERRERLEGTLSLADGALEDVRQRARNLQDDYNEAGRDTAERLRNAMDLAPNEPGWLSSAIDGFGDFMQGIGDWVDEISSGLIDVLTQLAPILAKIGEIAGLASFVVGLFALVPGLQFLAPVALWLGVVSLGATYLATVGETGSWTQALTNPDVIVAAAGLAMGLGAARVIRSMTSSGVITQGALGGVMPNAANIMSQGDDVMNFVLVANVHTSWTFANDLTSNFQAAMDFRPHEGWHLDNSPVASE
ncbi:putative T7SS-secreted protein [Streptomyces sp. 4N509B]|uniref:putative T7SS-secreted protein n=1 Tax=Streptomyces sp. 4N509B TaxID=3457413 RepID=UPI003FD4F35F